MPKLIDMTGKTIGHRKVLRRGENPHPGQGASFFDTECLASLGGCGLLKAVAGQRLRRGEDCSCQAGKNRIRDWAGHKNNNLVVLEVIHRDHTLHNKSRTNRSKQWKCECLLCEKIFVASSNQLAGIGRNPPRDSCGCDRNSKITPVTGEDHYKWKGGWTNTRLERTCAYANRKSREKGDPNRITLEFVISLWEEQEQLCYYCGEGLSLEMKLGNSVETDHMVSRKNDGLNVEENICLSCHDCNYQKRNKNSDEYLQFRRDENLPVNVGRI